MRFPFTKAKVENSTEQPQKMTSQDKYELTKSVKLVDVKGYLQKEFERAEDRESQIAELEKKIETLEKTAVEYDAMLVVQQKTQERIQKQDQRIKELRDKIEVMKDTEKLLNSKIIDIKVNAEKKLKAKDAKIKELKKQFKKEAK